jgi:ABC-type multidrug transport system ATPase subunit
MSSANASHTTRQDTAPVTPVLAADGVGKRYGFQHVLRDISLSFGVGEVVLLLGANGAGKSTLLRVLAQLVRPDTGRVVVPKGATIGFASHHTFLYGRLSVRENLALYRSLISGETHTLDGILDSWQLREVAGKPIVELSKGNQARASLARAFMGNPGASLLDEPSSNLDQRSVERLKQAVTLQSKTGPVVIATHDVHRLRDMATRVVVMERGRVLADSGTPATTTAIDAVIQRYVESNR